MGKPVVSCRSLRKSYGSTEAVRDVSLEVGRGQIMGILGPNGSGKTTTVECLQGLRQPDAGIVDVLGLDPATDLADLRRRVGTQLQDSALPQRIKVEEAIRLCASVSRTGPNVSALLSDWGLTHRRKAAFGSLSGGEQQRLFVALALVNNPDLVFFDEMTTGLDPAARHEAWALVEQVRDLGMTVVLVTHFMDEAERLCDQLVVMRQGLVVATGTAHQLIMDHGGGTSVRVPAAGIDVSAVRALPGVHAVQREGLELEILGETHLLMHLGHFLVEGGLAPKSIGLRQPTLEDAYLRLMASSSDVATLAEPAA